MKKLLLILTVTTIGFASCSKDKEGCNDRRASNYDDKVVVDDGSCVFTALTFYANASQYMAAGETQAITITNIEVTVDGTVIGSFNGHFNNGNQVCGATNTAVFNTNGESSVAWSAKVYRQGLTSPITFTGVYTGIDGEGCVIQQVLQ